MKKNKIYLCLCASLFVAYAAFGYPNSVENQTSVVVNTSWDLGYSTLFVGDVTPGNSLDIVNGGSITNGYFVIGRNPGADNNSVSISGTNATMHCYDGVVVGTYASSNSLTIANGGSATFGNVSLGIYPESTGNVLEINNATAATSELSIGGEENKLRIKNGGTLTAYGVDMHDGDNNTIELANGGKLNVSGSSINFFGSSNTININGQGSSISNSNHSSSLSFGDYSGGTGAGNTLLIQNGGCLEGFETIDFGNSASSSNNIIGISGSNTFIQAGFYGYGASNLIEITDGANVRSIYSGLYGKDTMIIINGSNSEWNVDHFSLEQPGNVNISNGGKLSVNDYISWFGEGKFNIEISDRGQLILQNDLAINSDNNTISVTGAGSVLSNDNHYSDFRIDSDGNHLILSQEGRLEGFQTISLPGLNNEFSLSGSNTASTINIRFEGGSNALRISDGATLYSPYMENDGIGNEINVGGKGALWQVDQLDMGGSANRITITNGARLAATELAWNGSHNRIEIKDGGTLALDSGYGIEIQSENNVIEIAGKGSVLSNSHPASLQFQAANNNLLLSNGGSLGMEAVYLGYGNPTATNILCSFSGSNTISTANIFLDGSSSSLCISEGATLNSYYLGTLGAGNLVDIGGTGSVWQVDQLDMGGSANRITITNGARLATTELAWNGSDNRIEIKDGGILALDSGYGIEIQTENNVIEIAGKGSILSNAQPSSLQFQAANNNLLLSNGGSLGIEAVYLGYGNPTATNILCSFSGSNTVSTANIFLDGSSNTLRISEGAPLSSYHSGIFGFGNVVDIGGTGSVWQVEQFSLDGSENRISITNSAKLAVTDFMWSGGGNHIEINDGGVLALDSSYGNILSSENNLITIDGMGSSITNEQSSDLIFDEGNNRLLVSNGGSFGMDAVYLGYGNPNATNILFSIRGADSTASLRRVSIIGQGNRMELSQGASIHLDELTMMDAGSLIISGSTLETDMYSQDMLSSLQLGISSTNFISPSLIINGSAEIDGSLIVTDIYGLNLFEGDQFKLIEWNTPSSRFFSSITLPALEFGLGWNTNELYTAGTIQVASFPDSDNDGMLDEWEIKHFGGDIDPNGNQDGDHHTNLEEYIAGMNPTNAASCFELINAVESVEGFVVSWPSVSNRLYKIYWTDHLTNTFENLHLGRDIEFPQNSYTDTVHGVEAGGYYKVDVLLK